MPRSRSEKKRGNQSSKVPRNQVASQVIEGLIPYFVKKLFSIHTEVGVKHRGRLRADFLAINMKSHIVICEVKSGWQDFAADHKWQQYLLYSNKLYFAISEDFWTSHGAKIADRVKGSGAGVIVCNGGSARVVLPARFRYMDRSLRYWLISKIAWIGGMSRANRKNV